MNQERMEIKINFTFGRYKKGQIVTVPSIGEMPAEKYWRDRIRDSKIDQCVSIVDRKKSSKKTAKSTNVTEQGTDK